MRLKFLLFLIPFLAVALASFGQGVADSGVAIHADPRLSVLFKKKHVSKPVAPVTKTNIDEAATRAMPATPGKAAAVAPKGVTATPTVKPGVDHSPTPLAVPLTTRKTGGAVYSGKGYRVQIYNGNDRVRAIKIKAEFMRKFPGVRTYLTYISPCFRVKVGDYRNRSDAEGMLREANAMYSPSMIVPDVINISSF